MGTRGFVTFVIDGDEKTAYNHRDSYPDGLGLSVLRWLRTENDRTAATGAQDWLRAITDAARSLRVVSPDSSPTAKDIERLRQWSWNRARHGGNKDLRDGQEWYDLLHETQGEPGLILEAGVIEDAGTFPQNSLFAEWGYVIDLDAGNFEVYEGFQRARHSKGRFAGKPGADGYSPVALKASWPLSELPDDSAFMAAAEGDES